MTVIVERAAETDLEVAFDYYESARLGLGNEFATEFRRGVERILQHPKAWQPLDRDFRRCRLHRFPYGIIYRIDEQAAHIVVAAVQHLNRRPGGWRRRP